MLYLRAVPDGVMIDGVPVTIDDGWAMVEELRDLIEVTENGIEEEPVHPDDRATNEHNMRILALYRRFRAALLEALT